MPVTSGPAAWAMFAFSIVQLGLALWMFARTLPLRAHALRGALAAGAIFLLATFVLSALVTLVSRTVGTPSLHMTTFAVFLVVLAGMAGAVVAVCDASVWAALFCTSSAYVTQTLASAGAYAAQLVFMGRTGSETPASWFFELLSMTVVYSLVWLAVVRPMERSGTAAAIDERDQRKLVGIVISIVLVLAFDVLNKSLPDIGAPLPMQLAYRIIHGVVCAVSLFVEYELLVSKHQEVEAATREALWAAERHQWEQSRANIDAINVKCHDIRHQIRQLGASGAVIDRDSLEDIAREVNVYDAQVRSGNEALDVILSERGLVCEREGIRLSVVADGSAVDFMAPADLYSLFGNAIENAMEAVGRVEDPELRSITLDVRRVAGMVRIVIENYYTGEVEFGANGLPRSSKGDELNHGFGTRSIQMVAERYGGTTDISADGTVYRLSVLIPES